MATAAPTTPDPSTPSPLDTSALDSDLSSLDTEAAQTQKQIDSLYGMIDKQRAAATRSETALEAVSADRARALSAPPPKPNPVQESNPLTRLAPLLLISAFGGRSSKLNASSMLGATAGTIQGFLAGDQEKLAQQHQAYEEAYKRWQDHMKQIDQVYKVYEDAYKGRLDYQQKALDATLKSLGEADAKRRMTIQDKANLDRAKTTLESQHAAAEATNAYRMLSVHVKLAALNQGKSMGQDISDADLVTLAKNAVLTGKDPAFGLAANNPVRARYQALKATVIKDMGGAGSAAAAAAQAKAAGAALSNTTKQFATISAQEATANKNLNLALQQGDLMQKTSGSPIVNKAILEWRRGVTGDPQTAAFVNALTVAKNEYEKVISGATGATGITDAARREGDALFSKINNFETLQAQMSVARREMSNRTMAYREQLNSLSQSMRSLGFKDTGTASDHGAVVRRGTTADGKKVVQYADGTIAYGE